MLICGDQVRLTKAECEQLMSLVADDPSGIRTRDGLETFVERHLETFKNVDNPSADFARRLLESFLPGPTRSTCEQCPAEGCSRRRA